MSKFCGYCGTVLNDSETFCSNCGASFNGQVQQINKKKHTRIILLCIKGTDGPNQYGPDPLALDE